MFFLFQNQAFSWDIEKRNDDYFLVQKDESYLIKKEMGIPLFEKEIVIKENPKYRLLIYFSGSAGTHNMVEIWRALIYSPDQKKILGDFPWKYKSTKEGPLAPKWIFSENTIKVRDDNFFIREYIHLD